MRSKKPKLSELFGMTIEGGYIDLNCIGPEGKPFHITMSGLHPSEVFIENIDGGIVTVSPELARKVIESVRRIVDAWEGMQDTAAAYGFNRLSLEQQGFRM